MFKKTKLNRIAIAVAMSIGMSTAAMAQETSAGIGGTVLSANGQAVAGATIVITDTRTGSVRTLSSTGTGRYNLRGLRVGGPYTVTVTDSGSSKTVEDVYLTLGDNLSLDLSLQNQEQIESILITGALTNTAYGSTGPVSNFGLDDLDAAPAINRDIKDLVRIDPRVYIDEGFGDAIQCAGASSRFNSLTIDGIRTNDNFGLGNSGYPTIRAPFSYDSIDQVAVELAPFDVQYGGFTACNINAVTKSGANDLFGGVFYDYTNDSLRGDELEGRSLTLGKFTEKRYGFNVGGALIKDKLFFFTSYEKLEGASLFDRGAADSSAAVPVLGVSQAQLDRIRLIANDLYSYDPGEIVSSLPVEDEKILFKLDWEINDQHRASLVYNYNDGDIIRESDGDANEFEFSNHYYRQRGEFDSLVGSVFSDWTDSFSTEVRIGKTDYEAFVDPLGGLEFGEFQIRTENNGSRATVYLGADDSRHANKLIYGNETIKIAGKYTVGDHIITGGYEYENLDVFNLFIQEAEGEYRFSSIDDFEAGTPNRITYENAAITNNKTDAGGSFSYQINTAYIQDEWYISSTDMEITFGLRYDWYTSDDLPPENPLVEAEYGFSNQQNLDGLDLLQPRIGVNWRVSDGLEVRGGLGLFSGGNPNVWISNNFTNNGIIQLENQDRSGTSVFDLEFVGGTPGFGVPKDLFDAVAAGQGRAGGINIQDPDFEIPAEWKYALGATYTFDDDYVLMADILYSDKRDAAIIRDVSRGAVGIAPDGRPIYDSINGRSQDFMLTNVKGDSGDSTTVSLALMKSYDNGLDWSLAYAFVDSNDVSPMTSSVAFSNYISPATRDAENPGVATSNYEIPHRFTMKISYAAELISGLETRFTVFGSANEGRPFSYVFDGDPGFGSSVGFIDHNLVYIPEENDSTVIYGDDFDLDAFNEFVENADLTRGEIMDRNSRNSDWWTKFDVKISQQFPGFMDGHRGEAYLLIENFGNFLNDDWGVLKEASFPRAQTIVDADINASGQYIYNDFIVPAGQSTVADASLYEIRVGVKYRF